MAAINRRKDDVIQIRASSEAKALLMRAASLRHQKLSEFMLESARESAQTTILDNNLFRLDDKAYRAFITLLDNPPEPTAAARARFRRKAPWAD